MDEMELLGKEGASDESAKPSKQSVAYSYLRSAIITGRYPHEKPLIEREICDKLGVSRTPVREALRRLGSEGLVDFIPNRGVFVSGISKEKALHMYEMKDALESMAARLCAQRATEKDIELMEECLKAHKQSLETNQTDLAVDLDLRFHTLLVECCGNPLIEQHAKGLLLQVRRLSQIAVYDTTHAWVFIKEHSAILEAIRSHDGDAAASLLSEHIRSVEEFQWPRWDMLL